MPTLTILIAIVAVIVIASLGLAKQVNVKPITAILGNLTIWIGLPVFAIWITGMTHGVTSWTQPVVAVAIWFGGFFLIDVIGKSSVRC